MSDPVLHTPAPPPPHGWNIWRWVLVVSLALNLLLLAAGVTRFVMGPPRMGRLAQTSYLHMIPRHFLAGMERARRDDLLSLLRTYRDRFRDSQDASRAAADRLAAAMVAEPFDEAALRDAISEINRNGAEQVGLGTQAAQDFILQLTAGERKSLAYDIRQRAGQR